MKKYAVIVAGGAGLRMGTAVPKQFLDLKGKPVIWYTLTRFLNAYEDLEIILVLPETHFKEGAEIVATTVAPERVTITSGGATRFHSVKNGLQRIQEHAVVLVHDGVRCLLSEDLIHRCVNGAMEQGNAIPAVSSVDSVRIETVYGNEPIQRDRVRMIQTPQTFFSDILKTAFEQTYDPSFTDEASVVEKLGVKIHLIEGESSNIKITKPIDILIAENILDDRAMIG